MRELLLQDHSVGIRKAGWYMLHQALRLRLTLLILMLSAVSASSNVMDWIDPADIILDQSFHLIIVAEAVELSKGPYTNSNPPRGIFRIHEVIRGHTRPKSAEIFWVARKPHEDFEPWTRGMPEDWRIKYYNRPLRGGWHERPFEGPAVGEKLIIFAVEENQLFRRPPLLRAVLALRYSKENRDIVMRNMAPADRHPRIQGHLLKLLVLAGPAALILLIVSTKTAGHQKGLFIRIALGISAAHLPLYLFYEQGNRTGGIRIDLLVVYPALVVSAVVLVISVALLWRGRRQLRRGWGVHH